MTFSHKAAIKIQKAQTHQKTVVNMKTHRLGADVHVRLLYFCGYVVVSNRNSAADVTLGLYNCRVLRLLHGPRVTM